MTVKVSLKEGDIPSVSIIANLIATTESNYRDCEITITISEGDIIGVHFSPTTVKNNEK